MFPFSLIASFFFKFVFMPIAKLEDWGAMQLGLVTEECYFLSAGLSGHATYEHMKPSGLRVGNPASETLNLGLNTGLEF